MKYILLIFLLANISFTNAQSVPQKLNYQAVARNSSGATLTSQSIAVKVEIVESNQTTLLYSERHVVTTNQFGLFTLSIGSGSVLSGTFSTIQWGAANKYLRTSIDLTGGTNYVLMGMSQLLSVPYALYSNDVPVRVSSSGDTVKIGNSFIIVPGASFANWFTTICGQTIMNKNLDVDHYRNGDLIPNVTDLNIWKTLTTGAYCYYNNDSATYASIYGKLYNWFAVNDPRGICPTGYHIPSISEWSSLLTCLGETQAAGLLKSTGTLNQNNGLWFSPNLGATNSTGFTALPGGYRDKDGVFGNINLDGAFWSRSESSAQNSWYLLINANYANAGKYDNAKTFGFSVRIMKD